MPKPCSICKHEKRTEIETAILRLEPLRSISRTYRVSEDALSRHKHNSHFLRALVKAHSSSAIKLASSPLEQMESIQLEALSILDAAKQSNDPRIALVAIREVREIIMGLARIMGEIKESPAVVVQQNILVNQETIGGAVQALLQCGAIALPEGVADERQESVAIEDGEMSREVGDRCSEPPPNMPQIG